MKKFLILFLKFILPFLILVAGIEMYVLFYPNTFNLKANYLKRNSDDIQTLILGSSHNQNALNPEFFHSNTANLANAGQDIQLDSALFFTYIDDLKTVNTVILEMDYHTLEEKSESDYFRLPWYNRFFGVELQPISLLNRISVYSSNPSFFNKLLIDEFNPKKIRYRYNKFGFITNDFPGVMKDLLYDSVALATTASDRLKDKHIHESVENYQYNRSSMDAIIRACLAKKIKVVLLSTPMYVTYIENEIPAKNKRRRQYIDSLIKIPNISYYDFENSRGFTVRDFKNDDHLNSSGAKKFSLMINSILLKSIAAEPFPTASQAAPPVE